MARIVFLGSPAPAALCLEALACAGHDVALVVTGPDRRRGRGPATSETAVKAAARRLGIHTSERLEEALEVGAEVGVVVAFGRIIGVAALEHLLFVNLHFSLLPRWRGAAPVERAILAGDVRTGVSLMQVSAGLDEGPVYAQVPTDIGDHEHADVLSMRLSSIGASLLVERLSGGVSSLGEAREQEGEMSYAPKIGPEELRLDWARPAIELERLVRLGRAWTVAGGRRLLVLDARVLPAQGEPPAPGAVSGTAVGTGDGVLELAMVKPAGRGAVEAAAWRRGAHLSDGDLLS